MPVKLTVCLPTSRRSDTFREALASVLREHEPDFEVIVIDDASPEDIPAVLAEFKDERLQYQRNPENLGMVPTLSKCLETGSGEFVYILHDDDRVLPGGLEKLFQALSDNPSAGASAGSVEQIDEAGNLNGNIWRLCDEDKFESGKDFYSRYITGQATLQPPGVMMRRSVIPQVGTFDPEVPFCLDMDLWLRACLLADIALVESCVAQYRIHSGSITKKFLVNAEIGHSYAVMLKNQYRQAKDSGKWSQQELSTLFKTSRQHFAMRCIAMGLLCFKQGNLDTSRKYFQYAASLAPDAGLRSRAWLLMLASFAGQGAYPVFSSIKRALFDNLLPRQQGPKTR